MSKNNVSIETEQDAMQIAKATQKPGQTKDQTKLIAKGIEKGIAEYKKRHKVKARELDKKRKKLDEKSKQVDESTESDITQTPGSVDNRYIPVLITLLVISVVCNVLQFSEVV